MPCTGMPMHMHAHAHAHAHAQASVLRMLEGSPQTYLHDPIVKYLEERDVKINLRTPVRDLVHELDASGALPAGVAAATLRPTPTPTPHSYTTHPLLSVVAHSYTTHPLLSVVAVAPPHLRSRTHGVGDDQHLNEFLHLSSAMRNLSLHLSLRPVPLRSSPYATLPKAPLGLDSPLASFARGVETLGGSRAAARLRLADTRERHYSLARSLARSLTHSLTPLTHSLTHSLTPLHSLHSLT